MRYSSTNKNSDTVGLREAVNRCVASDGGLFMPEVLPTIPRAFFNNIDEMSLRDIAFVVATSFFGGDVDASDLKNIVDYSFAFDAPLRKVGDVYVMELFNGPTLTFKDYGARFMAGMMRCLDRTSVKPRNVIVATTGNTGAAAANGLHDIPGINVLVLYPKGQLDRRQTSQITALGGNIYALEVAGTIEDCKRMMQNAIADSTLTDYSLTGANSINIIRLIPQISFALHAYSRLKALGVEDAEKALYVIPTGNMSNVVSALMAKLIGCPMGKVVAAVGANNQVARALEGHIQQTSAKPLHTLAHSIDMCIPSGWPRVEYLFKERPSDLPEYLLAAKPVPDDEIAQTVATLKCSLGYDIDTHGAVAYAAATHVESSAPKVVYATGHPAKQIDIFTLITNRTVELPVQLTRFMSVRRPAMVLAPTMPALKKFILTIQ